MATVGNSNRPELRKSPRRPFHYNACILIQEKHEPCLCHIADISETGARIVMERECELPDHFILLLSRKGDARRRCRLVWRDGLSIGVEFPTPPQA
jgi:hypothetical protein